MKRNAFTLIELLVVVAIIVLLIGILIPVLGRAKVAAYSSATQAELSQISGCADTYYTVFSAYPGPGSIADTAGGGGGATKCMSGAQNLLLGLSYAMAPGNSAPVSIPFSNGGKASVDPNKPNGPIDYSQPSPIVPGMFKQMSPFFDATSKNMTPPTPGTAPNATWPAGGIYTVGASLGTDIAFPVIVDRFPDALPILYYRRTPGVDTNLPQNAYGGASTLSAYYFNENAEYTQNTKLTAVSGTVCPQSATGFINLNLSSLAGNSVEVLPTGKSPSSVAHGGYILVTAGPDRIYGPGTSTTSDDITLIGGN